MKIKFYKYQGAGNDFIIIDNRTLEFDHQQPQLLKKLCDRRFGIGADGIMFVQNADGFDFEMVYYNSDGQPSSMCGNGGRCIVAYAKHLQIFDKETDFLAVDGPHYAKISESGDWVSLQMIDVDLVNKDGQDFIINTGSPHYIRLSNDISGKDVVAEGRAIRYHPAYKTEGINVNFVEEKADHLFVRTYERGVEDETFACGTGATAAALAFAKHKSNTGTISQSIKVLGGDLTIKFNYDGKHYRDIFLEGPAVKVFEGEIVL